MDEIYSDLIKVDKLPDQVPPLWMDCHCNAHAVKVEAEDDQIFISLWTLGFEDRGPSLIDRIKTCWKVLTTGRVSFADVVLTQQDAKRLQEFLSNAVDEGE